jgi:hypothetical protein
MTQDTDQIRQQMANTRCSISEKLDLLERRVVNTVEGATNAVADTVETVKESLRDSVQTVQTGLRESVHSVQTGLDPIRQAERNPWVTLAVSFGAGYAAGKLLEGNHASPNMVIDQPPAWPHPSTATHAMAMNHGSHQPASRTGMLQQMVAPLEPEIRKLKGLGIGILFGVVRDFLHEAAPASLRTRVTEVADDMTRRMGGEPVQGPVFEGAFAPRTEERFESTCSRERRPAF